VIEEIVFDPFGPTPEPELEPRDHPPPSSPTPQDELAQTFQETIRQTERRLVKAALERTRYNQRRAAETLGLSYDQFRGLLKKHGGVDEL
jgi:psp operon transcriptional activator